MTRNSKWQVKIIVFPPRKQSFDHRVGPLNELLHSVDEIDCNHLPGDAIDLLQ